MCHTNHRKHQNCVWVFAWFFWFYHWFKWNDLKINQSWLEIAKHSFILFCAYAISLNANTTTGVQNEIFIEMPILKQPVSNFIDSHGMHASNVKPMMIIYLFHESKICSITMFISMFVKPHQWPTPSESIAIYCVRKLVSCVTHLQSCAKVVIWNKKKKLRTFAKIKAQNY